ncbi:MAG TPA: FG-GAP-like repeat-containing protein [Clostridia bacterium]|nr:FG-GAP-like repeat-containing protein [Clostridia bacterium]
MATPRHRIAGGSLTVVVVAVLTSGPVLAADGFLEDVDVIAEVHGDAASGFFGWAVAELRDVDADGATDFILSDPARSTGGLAAVYSGATGAELWTVERPGPNLYGYSIADAGDTNRDGTSDVLVGDISGNGSVELLSGADGSLLHRFAGLAAGDRMGTAVAGAGDVDGDGAADLLIGAGGVDTANGIDSGRVHVFSGDDHALIRAIDGPAPGEAFGSGTDLAGDLDVDGRPDFVVGARHADPKGNGAAYAVSSATGGILWRFTAPKTGEDLGSFFVAGLEDIDGDGTADVYAGDYADRAHGQGTGRAFVLSGADGTPIHTWTGYRNKEGVGPGREAGDVDGDGVQDLAVGHYTSSDGGRGAGKVVIFSGATGDALRTITSTTPRENLGFDTVGLGDVNGDGLPDLLVSAATGQAVYVIAGTE